MVFVRKLSDQLYINYHDSYRGLFSIIIFDVKFIMVFVHKLSYQLYINYHGIYIEVTEGIFLHQYFFGQSEHDIYT